MAVLRQLVDKYPYISMVSTNYVVSPCETEIFYE
jgi:hypothetical protein